ncbi:MAG: fumarate reductase subunit C [Vicinamibacteria bacterium]
MSDQVHYTLYHPKWYRRPVSVWWWLERWPYTKFVLRELTSVAVGSFALLTLWQLSALHGGEAAYQDFLARLESPAFIALSVFCLGGILFHALTWFHLAPKAMVVRLAGRRVPDGWIVVSNYVGWIAVSAIVVWIWVSG